jgi:hypothetical protein
LNNFYNKRGKDFAVHVLQELFDGMKLDIQSSTHGRDDTLDLHAVVYPRPTVRQRSAASSPNEACPEEGEHFVTCKDRLVSWLPVNISVDKNLRKRTSDVYVHDLDSGHVIVLGEVMNEWDSCETKLVQLHNQLLFCLEPKQRRIFGILFAPRAIQLIEYEVTRPYLSRSQSEYMLYENDGMRKVFRHILAHVKVGQVGKKPEFST